MDELNFLQGRRVLLTGHTGFKGSWLSLWLCQHGARVIGYAADVPTSPSLFESLDLRAQLRDYRGDIRDADRLRRVIHRERPEVIIHLAAQALVPRSYQDPKETFDVNVAGTVNVLEALREAPGVRVLINVTSDKCYEDRGWGAAFQEEDSLGGRDPYSASKACAELITAAYRRSFFAPERAAEHGVGLATVRAGNVIGGGDWAAHRLVPDCIRALRAGKPVLLRRPQAVRPWQHVLEALAGYLLLAVRLWKNPGDYTGAWNFGPPPESSWPVVDVAREVFRLWGRGDWPIASGPQEMTAAETDCLRLCSAKATARLAWRPQWNLEAAIARTVEWYQLFEAGADATALRAFSCRQIAEYEAAWDQSVGACKTDDRGPPTVVELGVHG